MPKKKRTHKYKEGQIVYCRPSVVSGSGMSVYKCRVTEAVWTCAGTPYYTFESVDDQTHLFMRYGNEISLRPERLVKQARKAIEEEYSGYIGRYKELHKDLDRIMRSAKCR